MLRAFVRVIKIGRLKNGENSTYLHKKTAIINKRCLRWVHTKQCLLMVIYHRRTIYSMELRKIKWKWFTVYWYNRFANKGYSGNMASRCTRNGTISKKTLSNVIVKYVCVCSSRHVSGSASDFPHTLLIHAYPR